MFFPRVCGLDVRQAPGERRFALRYGGLADAAAPDDGRRDLQPRRRTRGHGPGVPAIYA